MNNIPLHYFMQKEGINKAVLNLLYAFVLGNPFIAYLLTLSIIDSVFIFMLIFTFICFAREKFQKWFREIFINIMIILSLLMYFETVFRYAFAEYVIEDLYRLENKYYFNKPYLNKILKDKEYTATYKTNKQGFRIATWQSAEKTVEGCDWLFLGDSYTQGAQVEFEELYTSELYRYFPNKIILNAGISGFGIPEEYNLLKDMVGKHKPSKVFLQLCSFNDFMNVSPQSRTAIDYLMHYSDLVRSLLFNLKYRQPEQLPLGRWTEPFYDKELDNIDYNIFYKISSPKKKKDIENLRYYVKKLSEVVKASGAELVILLVPTKEQLYYKYFNEVVSNFRINSKNLDMNAPNKILREITQSQGIRFIDLYEGFAKAGTPLFFEYDEHLNPQGHRVMAEIIAGCLKYEQPKGMKFISKSFFGDRYPVFINPREMLFQSPRDGDMEIFQSDRTQSIVQRLTFNNIDELHACPIPNSRDVMMTEGSPESYRTRIVVFNKSTFKRRYLSDETDSFSAIPCVSSDGRYCAYAKWFYDRKKTVFSNPQIYLYDLKNRNEIKVTSNDYENWRPVFSSDGSKIAYISKRNGNFDLYIFELNTGRETELTHTDFDEWDPFFSPKGDHLLFSSRKNGNWDLAVISLSDKQYRLITETKGDEWDACFSPSDEKIFYAGEFGFLGGIYSIEYVCK